MNDTPPSAWYRQQIKMHTVHLARLQKKQSRLGWLRLLTVLFTIFLSYQVFQWAGALGWLPLFSGIVLFLAILTLYTNNASGIENLERIISINKEELKMLAHQYSHRFDGHQFLSPVHAYAVDLDLFGSSSLYQYINRCSTEGGRKKLADNLLAGLSAEQVKERQEAVKELAPLAQWRQQLQAYAIQTPVTKAAQNKITDWINKDDNHFHQLYWRPLLPVYSLLTTLTALAALLGYLPVALFSFLFILYFIFSSWLSKKAVKTHQTLSGIVEEVDALSQLIGWIESISFSSTCLTRLQEKIKPRSASACGEIKVLKDILNRFDLRLNIFLFILLNSFWLWDVRQIRDLNAWKKRNRQLVQEWFEATAEMEVLISIAALHFNQPAWAFAQFKKEYFVFCAKEIGHPLIPDEQRIKSDFFLEGRGKLALITGSNMAGKSTFLRSLGVNTVLAQIGAPVCAQSCYLSMFKLMTSMRIADNLAENTSTFYAELKKLQGIIAAIKEGKQLFILLDEILRGTNSLDRHTGSKALIRQLIKEGAVAVLATHDVALAKGGGEENGAIENYHFDVHVENDELYFDYKLKEGICKSLNASLLMRKIGIEL